MQVACAFRGQLCSFSFEFFPLRSRHCVALLWHFLNFLTYLAPIYTMRSNMLWQTVMTRAMSLATRHLFLNSSDQYSNEVNIHLGTCWFSIKLLGVWPRKVGWIASQKDSECYFGPLYLSYLRWGVLENMCHYAGLRKVSQGTQSTTANFHTRITKKVVSQCANRLHGDQMIRIYLLWYRVHNKQLDC
jgi:hypothetical protein